MKKTETFIKTINMAIIDTDLLIVKGIYFTFYAASGALLPFLPVYLKQLGLTLTQTGVIFGIMPFVTSLVKPVCGVIADKSRRHKLMLMFCLVIGGVFYILLLWVPIIANGVYGHARTEVKDTKVEIYDCCLRYNMKSELNDDAKNVSSIYRNSYYYTEIRINTCNRSDEMTSFDIQTSDFSECIHVVVNQSFNVKENTYFVSRPNIKDAEYILNCSMEFMCKIFLDDKTNLHDIAKSIEPRHGETYSAFSEVDGQFIVCFLDLEIHADDDNTTRCVSYVVRHDNTAVSASHYIFWVCLVIMILCNISCAPVMTLIDTIAYDVLGSARQLDWGHQRLWGSIGCMILALLSTYLMDKSKHSSNTSGYSLSFYLFTGLLIISSLIAKFLKVSDKLRCTQPFSRNLSTLRSARCLLTMVVVTVFGIMNAAIQGFLFWYLTDLGGSQILLGVCLVAECSLEIVMLFYSGQIIRRLGHEGCICLAALAFVGRFLGFSLLSDPWFVLAVEPLHGITFGLFYATVTSYANVVAPPGTAATVMGIFAGLYYGVGKGLGSLLTGWLFEPSTGLGPVWTFRLYAILAGSVLVAFWVLNKSCLQTVSSRKHSQTQDMPVTTEKLIPEDCTVIPEDCTVVNGC